MACEHENQRLTRRAIRGGSVQYVYQCMDCGQSMNKPIAHSRVQSEFSGLEIPDYDESIKTAYHKRRVAASEDEWTMKKAAFDEKYRDYLKGPQWAEKRRLVLVRCKGLCEGCAAAPAVEVHHLTYEHVFDEFLFELVGVCKACHDRARAEPGNEA